MSTAGASAVVHVEPVFVVNSKLPGYEQLPYSTHEICAAAERVCGFESMIGAQRIGGLWRVYPTKREFRDKILVQGITLRGVLVTVRNENPFIVRRPDGSAVEQPSTRVVIGNVPLSYSDEEILKAIKALGCELRSQLFAERDRDDKGKLTHWKTGRRFLYIATPTNPLQKTLQIGPFNATIYHREQKQLSKDKVCSKCFQKGHQFSTCPNPMKCRQCLEDGHKAGDEACKLVPQCQDSDDMESGGEEENTCGGSEKSEVLQDSGSEPRKENLKVGRGRSRSRKHKERLTGDISRREGSSAKRSRPSPTNSPTNADKVMKFQHGASSDVQAGKS